jgi:hypothetical protein
MEINMPTQWSIYCRFRAQRIEQASASPMRQRCGEEAEGDV